MKALDTTPIFQRRICAWILCVFAALAHAGDAEDVFWDSVVKGNAREEYELYLKQYPTGRHAQEARQKIEASREKARAQQDAKKQRQVQTEPAKRTEEEFRQKEAEIKRLSDQLRQREQADATRQRAEQEGERKRAEQASMRPGPVFRDCADCPEMVVIPAGSFEMGSNNGQDDEKPVHIVKISKPFAIGRTEVTQEQWRAVIGSEPSSITGFVKTWPVVRVSWDEVQNFIRVLNQRTGKSYRLPSESEWEYACRAGGVHTYCGSDNLDAVAWYGKNSDSKIHPVAGKQPNALGLYDMSGNAWEWVEDCWNDSYNSAPAEGSAWLSGNCTVRVLRGGPWPYDARFARAAGRSQGYASGPGGLIGFRLARMLP